MLWLAAEIRAFSRRFFVDLEYLEVETPLLSHDVVVDAHLHPFAVSVSEDAASMFLQTSPEAAMKRLLAAGSGSIFQITKSFRHGEVGQRHNPEFTIVEWYGVGTSYRDQMDLTEKLIHSLFTSLRTMEQSFRGPKLPIWTAMENSTLNRPFAATTYDEAFRRIVGRSVLDATTADLQALVGEKIEGWQGRELPSERDELLNLLLAECIEPKLGVEQPEFLYDYPISQAALAECNPHDERTACRFELYCNGVELCNGYQELVDADELRQREEAQNALRSTHAAEQLPGAPLMEAAMRSGLPQCSGVALGLDRLIMCLTGTNDIRVILPFPFDRA